MSDPSERELNLSGQTGLFPHQTQALSSTSPSVLLLGGVGSGKTQTLGHMCIRGAAEQAGCDGAIFAPSYRLFKRVTFPSFRRVVPAELYTWKAADQVIEWVNGSRTYVLGVDRDPEARIIGMNLAWFCWDEPGASSNGDIIGLANERLRAGDPALRFGALFTSPHGFTWLADFAAKPSTEVIHARTYDNPTLDAAYIARLEEHYPPGTLIHRQEMLGELVSRTGKVYGDVFSRQRHTAAWSGTSAQPWVCTVDPGFRASAWLAWQKADDGRGWVVTREWLLSDMTTDDAAARVRRDMGRPPRRVLMDTPSRQNSRLHVNDYQAIVDAFGASCHVRVLGGHERSSDWRHKAVISGLTTGALRVSSALCLARTGAHERGLVYSLETMEWPQESTRDEAQDQKDPRKHALDALEFGAAVLTPPSLARSEDRARHYQQAA